MGVVSEFFKSLGKVVKGMLLISAVIVLAGTAALAGVRNPGAHFGKSGKANGDFAVAVASGNVRHPHKIFAKVTSHPARGVDGAWTVVCSRGFGAGSRSGNLGGHTPLIKRLSQPYANPDTCTASADAQLRDTGSVRVSLFYKR